MASARPERRRQGRAFSRSGSCSGNSSRSSSRSSSFGLRRSAATAHRCQDRQRSTWSLVPSTSARVFNWKTRLPASNGQRAQGRGKFTAAGLETTQFSHSSAACLTVLGSGSGSGECGRSIECTDFNDASRRICCAEEDEVPLKVLSSMLESGEVDTPPRCSTDVCSQDVCFELDEGVPIDIPSSMLDNETLEHGCFADDDGVPIDVSSSLLEVQSSNGVFVADEDGVPIDLPLSLLEFPPSEEVRTVLEEGVPIGMPSNIMSISYESRQHQIRYRVRRQSKVPHGFGNAAVLQGTTDELHRCPRFSVQTGGSFDEERHRSRSRSARRTSSSWMKTAQVYDAHRSKAVPAMPVETSTARTDMQDVPWIDQC